MATLEISTAKEVVKMVIRSKRNLVLAAFVAVVGIFLFAFASTASASWTRLGGDPLVPGGVNTRADFVRVMTSNKGTTAMSFAGLNKAERQAVVLATRKGDFKSCSLKYGMKFKRMSFGINGTSVDRNVTFLDPRYRYKPAAAWCMNVPLGKGGPVLHLLVPVKCGNVAIINRTPAPKKPTPAPKPKPTPPVAPAPAPQQQQQQQQQTVVVVIVPPVGVTPPPANQLPLCTLYKVPQHVYPNMGYDMQVSCTDPDGDPISVSAVARRGSVSFTGVAGTTYTFHYIASSTVGDDTVTFTVVDSKGGQSSVHTDLLNPVDEK